MTWQEFTYCVIIYSGFYLIAELFGSSVVLIDTSNNLKIRNQEEFKKSMENTMETLDDNKNTMREGTYIEMCNNVKNIWECVS
tara:strand:+ start:926 stop:1174 length:249 start_codon:yes stop_codon:yes gene_type:complete